MEAQPNINPNVLNRDYTLIIDASGSMDDPAGNGSSLSRWKAAEEGTVSVARLISQFDPDGITLYTFSTEFRRNDNVNAETVKNVFQTVRPNGSTNLGGVLNHAFTDYLNRRSRGQTKANGEMVIVVTDGAPTDERSPINAIVNVTRQIRNARELTVLFVQIGNDSAAATYLSKLDDQLTREGAAFDIVSVITSDKLGSRDIGSVIAQAISEAKV